MSALQFKFVLLAINIAAVIVGWSHEMSQGQAHFWQVLATGWFALDVINTAPMSARKA